MLASRSPCIDNRLMRTLIPALLITLLTGSHPLVAAEDGERAQAGVTSLEDQLIEALDSSYELLELDTSDDRYSLVFRPAMTANALGNLLLLPDTGSAEAWLEQSRALAAYLPEHGWNLMIVQPPLPPDPSLPTRTLPVIKRLNTAPATATEDTDTDAAAPAPTPTAPAETPDVAAENEAQPEQTQPFPDRYNARFQAAWAELVQRGSGKQKLVLGIGSSATWAAQFALARGEDIDLAVLNPRPTAAAPEGLGELMVKLKERTLIDLYYHPLPGYPDAEPDARQRRLLAQREGLSRYHQSRLPGVFRGWSADMPWMTRKVRGILERIYLSDEAEPEGQAPQVPQLQPPQPPGTRPQPQPAKGPSSV